jgi:hypothetical protein
MRPLYETQLDLKNEASVADVMASIWKCQMTKLQPRDAFDYAAVRGKDIAAFVEIKTRTNPMNRYPTYMISMTKIISANAIFMSTGVPSFLAVRWTDCIGWVRLNNANVKLEIGGRTDRSDAQDIEPVCHISISKFTVV